MLMPIGSLISIRLVYKKSVRAVLSVRSHIRRLWIAHHSRTNRQRPHAEYG